RKSYVTGRKLHEFFDKVNNKSKSNIFIEKNRFAEVFSEYLGRKIFMLDLDGNNINDAKSWLSDKNIVFAKPSKGVEGRGVTRLVIDKNIERSEEHTSELQSRFDLVCRLLLEKKKRKITI